MSTSSRHKSTIAQQGEIITITIENARGKPKPREFTIRIIDDGLEILSNGVLEIYPRHPDKIRVDTQPQPPSSTKNTLQDGRFFVSSTQTIL